MIVCFEVRPRSVYFLVNLRLTTLSYIILVIADIENPEINGNEIYSPPSTPPEHCDRG